MIKFEFYVIRHKETRKLMPQMKRRGYTHWNPGKSKEKLSGELPVPRLFVNLKSANAAVTQWIALPNAEYRGYVTHLGEDDYDISTKDDGRKKEDLEIIPARLVLK